jgi:hypothetical protein
MLFNPRYLVLLNPHYLVLLNPRYLVLLNLGFSVRVISLSWVVPIIASGTRVSPLHDLAVQKLFQGSW